MESSKHFPNVFFSQFHHEYHFHLLLSFSLELSHNFKECFYWSLYYDFCPALIYKQPADTSTKDYIFTFSLSGRGQSDHNSVKIPVYISGTSHVCTCSNEGQVWETFLLYLISVHETYSNLIMPLDFVTYYCDLI